MESPKGFAMTTYLSKSPVTGANNGVEPRAKQQPCCLPRAGFGAAKANPQLLVMIRCYLVSESMCRI